jgi:hypothetical protein
MTPKNIIYGLVDPRDGQLRYVGKSMCGLKRARSHSYPGYLKRDRTRTGNWIRSLQGQSLKPEVLLLEVHEKSEDLPEAEIWNIAYWKSVGAELFNHTTGGEGTPGHKMSALTRQRLREANLGIKHSLGKKQTLSEEQRLALAERARKRSADPAIRAKISKTLIGKKQSLKTVELRAAKLRGQRRTPEQRSRMSIYLRVPHPNACKSIVDQNGKLYSSVDEAADYLGINSSCVSRVLNGHRKHTKGYVFSYVEIR